MFGKEEFEEMHRGRGGIDNAKRDKPSQRAMKGNISVIRRRCPYCSHHKAISYINSNKVKCAKCKKKY